MIHFSISYIAIFYSCQLFNVDSASFVVLTRDKARIFLWLLGNAWANSVTRERWNKQKGSTVRSGRFFFISTLFNSGKNSYIGLFLFLEIIILHTPDKSTIAGCRSSKHWSTFDHFLSGTFLSTRLVSFPRHWSFASDSSSLCAFSSSSFYWQKISSQIFALPFLSACLEGQCYRVIRDAVRYCSTDPDGSIS